MAIGGATEVKTDSTTTYNPFKNGAISTGIDYGIFSGGLIQKASEAGWFDNGLYSIVGKAKDAGWFEGGAIQQALEANSFEEGLTAFTENVFIPDFGIIGWAKKLFSTSREAKENN